MTTLVGGICPRCGQFHDLFLAVDGSIVCRNADGASERIRQLEAERDAARAKVAELEALMVELKPVEERERDEWVRADERERCPDWLDLTLELDEAKAERDAARAALADLRTNVLALPAPLWMAEDPSDALIWRGDVLALLDEDPQKMEESGEQPEGKPQLPDGSVPILEDGDGDAGA